MKSDRLIRTKLHLPVIRPGIVPRTQLQARLLEGLQGPLTLVTAPAGFGKTTLVASSVAALEMPAGWLSLDKDDNQPGRFLNYLIAALHDMDPRTGTEAMQIMAEIQPAAPEAVLTSLVNDLDAADGERALVLDDYQFISSPAVHDSVAFLLEHCPQAFHLVIATRSDPPLPLARLRARGRMVELRTADLRFSELETAQFLNDLMHLQLDAGSIAALAERTEGWIAGLQMAALSMRHREDVIGFIEGFSGTHRYILDYLLEEVLAGQPPEVQHFLLCTSTLGRLCASLCDAVLAAADGHAPGEPAALRAVSAAPPSSGATLEYLERANLFLVPLDDERIWYRYHHLFADLLLARLQQHRPAVIPRLHLRAAEWLEHNGLITEAIQHLYAAHEIERAADLIERYGPSRLADSDPSVMQMAAGLPAELLISRPKIGTYQAWVLIIEGKISTAVPLLEHLRQQLAGAEPGFDLHWLQAVVASALAFLAPPGTPPELNPLPETPVLDEIPSHELILRNAADFLYGMALARRGQLAQAIEFSVQAVRREKAAVGAPVIPTLAPFLTRIYLMHGRLTSCEAVCREFLGPIREQGIRFIYTAGSMKIDLGEVLLERNQMEPAERYIREGLQDNEIWWNIMTDGFGGAALARLLMAKQDFAAASQVVEHFEKNLSEHARPREFEEDFRTLRARLWLKCGDLEKAWQWADQVVQSELYDLNPELYRLTLARIRLAQGRLPDVEGLLAGATPLITSGSWITRKLEFNLLLAAAYAGQQRLPEALELIDASLALAEPEGYLLIFFEVGEPARELLAAYLRTDTPAHQPYARKILDAFAHPAPAAGSGLEPGGLIEALTGREMEVLRLLALGMTNREIAAQLIVSPGTVKAHTAAIYRKLDAANRTQAVARARQLHLIS